MSSSSDPSKLSGNLHSAKGAAVEAVGSMTGSTDWQQAGKQERSAGETEYKAAQAEGYVEGTTDRLRGKKDTVVGSVTGDKVQETQGNVTSEKGQTQQQLNK